MIVTTVKFSKNRTQFLWQLQLFVLFVIALVIRCLHAYYCSFEPVSDQTEYLRYSEVFFFGRADHVESTTLFPPGYAVIAALAKLLGGAANQVDVLRYMGAVGDALTCVVLAMVGRLLCNTGVGLLAGWVWALYLYAIMNSQLLLPDSFFILASVVGLYLCLAAERRTRKQFWWAIAAGVSLGVASLIRSNGAAAILFIPAFLWLRSWKWSNYIPRAPFSSLRPYLLVAGVGLLVIFPWSLRNSLVIGRPILVSDNMGHSLALANNPNSDGTYVADYPPGFLDPNARDQRKEMARAGFRFLRDNPRYLAFVLLPNKLDYLTWRDVSFWPWTNTEAVHPYATHPVGPYLHLPLVHFSVLIWTGLLGFVLMARRRSWLIPVFWALSIAPLFLLLPLNRYRLTADFYLALGLAALIWSAFKPLSWRYRSLLVVIIVGTSVVVTGIRVVAYGGPSAIARDRLSSINGLVSFTDPILYSNEVREIPTQGIFRHQLFRVKIDESLHGLVLVRAKIQLAGSGVAMEDRDRTANIEISWADENDKTITVPATPSRLLVPRTNVVRDRPQTLWNVVLVPPRAKDLRVIATTNATGKLIVHEVEVRGGWKTPSQPQAKTTNEPQ